MHEIPCGVARRSTRAQRIDAHSCDNRAMTGAESPNEMVDRLPHEAVGAAVSSFSPGQERWIAGIGLVRDAVRQALVTRQLEAQIEPGSKLYVLDVGSGQGSQAIALARLGHVVTGVDVSQELLLEAERAAAAEPGDIRQRLRFELGDALHLNGDHFGRYDLVCCHGLAMYLPNLDDLVAALVAATRTGGLVSLLTRNRAGIAMRAGMMKDWAATLEGFDATHYTNRLAVKGARADEPAAVRTAFSNAGAESVSWYGVRLFTDHWTNEKPPGDFAALLAAEEEAGQREPYRLLAALTHTVARVPHG
jgi:S-adenosylmethionine-dependent methyltransferase